MKFMHRTLIIFLFSVVTCFGDSIPGSTYIDFETGTNGNTLSPTVISNMTHGLVYQAWVGNDDGAGGDYGPTNSSYLTISTNAQCSSYTPFNVSGTTYTGAGTRGLRFTSGGHGFMVLKFPTAQYPLSVGYHIRHTGNALEWHGRDLVCFNSDPASAFQMFQLIDDQSTGDITYQSHWCFSSEDGNIVPIAKDHWYWVTMLFARNGETFKIRVYDTADNSLLSEEGGTIADCSPTGAELFAMGGIKYCGTAGLSIDYDNLIINTNGVWPLGPGTGPDIGKTIRAATLIIR